MDQYQGSWEGCPTTAPLADGNFVVAWERYAGIDQSWGQVVTPGEAKKDVEFTVGPSDPAKNASFPGVAPLGTDFVVVWTEGQGCSGPWDVWAQRVGEGFGPAPECAPAPMTDCFDPVKSRTSTLAFSRRGGDPARGRLKWRWKGEATTREDFGNPRFDTGFAFCLYDASGAPQPLVQAQAPASGTCVSIPCWRDLGGSVAALEYYDRLTNDDGILRLRLKPGTDNRSVVFVQGKGVNLDLPDALLVAPIVAQVQGSNGSCWSAIFQTNIRKNVTDAFTGRSN